MLTVLLTLFFLDMIVFGKMPDLPRSYFKIKHFDTKKLQKSETQKEINMNLRLSKFPKF